MTSIKRIVNRLRIKRLINKGFDYYTITVDGKITDYIFTIKRV